SATVMSVAAHDGDLGLVKQDGYEWMIRTSAGGGPLFSPGQTLSAWVKFTPDRNGFADGRAYLAFGANPNRAAGGAPAPVVAPNTGELLLQREDGYYVPTDLASTAGLKYDADKWYRAEVAWDNFCNITGNFYDSDGTTLLYSVAVNDCTYTGGGIGFRAFGADKYFDTV